MLAHRVLDHHLVCADDERCPLDEEEQPDGFQRGYRRLRQAAVKIVHNDHQLVDVGGIEQFLELVAECVNMFGQVVRDRLRILEKITRSFREALDILGRNMLLRLAQEASSQVIDPLELIQRGDPCKSRQSESAGFSGKLEPVNALENLLRRIGYLRTRGSCSAQLVNDRLYNDRLGVFESFESPAIKPEAQRALVVLERGLQHLQHTGFSSPPISMHRDGDRRFRGSPD
nr:MULTISPECIES: hypothetical protein [unclassified Burkholderia]